MIRKAEIKDIHQIGEALRGFFDETGIPGDFDLNHWVRCWSSLISSDTGEIFVAEKNGQVAGAFAAIFVPNLNTGLLMASELLWYVRPEFRRGSLGLRLYRSFEQEASRRGVAVLAMAHLHNRASADSLRKFYLREGFELAEHTYRKTLWAMQ